LPVNVEHQVGLRDVQRLEAAIDEDPLAVEHRPHRAVTDEHAGRQGIEKRKSGHQH
jgi:low affinity Fe/Cu permease